MKALSVFLALMLTLVACGASTTQATLVDADKAQELIDSEPDLVVVDVRTPEEIATGTLPGAISIDLSSPTFQSQVEALDRDATYLVYCRSGNRSAQATSLMSELGFTNVYELDGGIVAWVNDGLALTGS